MRILMVLALIFTIHFTLYGNNLNNKRIAAVISIQEPEKIPDDNKTKKKNQQSNQNNGINKEKKSILIGLNLGVGIGSQTSLILTDATIKPKLSFHGGARSIFYFTKTLGFIVDIEAYYYNTREENTSGQYKEYKLLYLGLLLAPVLRVGGFNFYAGTYYGFILSAKFSGDSTSGDDFNTENCTMPDIGFVFGAGYKFRIASSTYLYISFSIRNQFNNFVAYNDPVKTGSKMFSFYLNFSLLFGVK